MLHDFSRALFRNNFADFDIDCYVMFQFYLQQPTDMYSHVHTAAGKLSWVTTFVVARNHGITLDKLLRWLPNEHHHGVRRCCCC